MRISELSRRSGVPVATVKYYLREGLLPPGTPTSRTQAQYDEEHVRRLRLVRALLDVGGLSVATARAVLATVDAPPDSWHDLLGAAHATLPVRGGADDGEPEHALAAVSELGWHLEPGTPALWSLEKSLDAVDAAGVPMTDERLHAYGRAAEEVAEVDVGGSPTASPIEAALYVVLGTVLYEPVLLSLRRLAHVHVSARLFRDRT
ncbi:MerR family transcriptional regulator [Angustibacter aerolatus]